MQQLSIDIINGRRKPAHFLKVDMTPMVDLGFLLITFFIFTTTLSEKTTMNLIVPKEGIPTDLKESNALTAVLTKNDKIYMYEGNWQEAIRNNKVTLVGYDASTGIRSFIREKQKRLTAINAKEDLMLIIKPLDNSSYKNLVDVLDEATINGIKRYAVVAPSIEERDYSPGS